MSTEPIVAYLSAAKSDRLWAGALHTDLERCLRHAGEEGSVFWEAADVGAGEVIPAVQQAVLDRARVFLLVVTPEALADRSAVHQWQSFLHRGRHGPERKVVPVVLAAAPLPPFLDGLRAVDFAGHDAEGYRHGLGRLMAAILERSQPPPLPDDLEIPDCPAPRLPAELRGKLVEWLAPVLRHDEARLIGLGYKMSLQPPTALLHPPSAACGASNAIVLHAGKDDPILAALRLVDQLADELLPFDRPRRREFLSRWFGRAAGGRDDARAEAALAELDAPGLRDLAGNPLYLTLMALLLEQKKSPSRRRSELYRQVFALLLQGRHKHDREGFRPIERPATVHAVLRRLAWGMTEENRGALSREELEDRLYRDELEELRVELRKVPRWDAHLGRHFLDDEAHKVGILGPHDGEEADWRFWHRTFREALTAERLHEMDESAVLALASEIAGQESRWAEPFALLAGRVAEPDALIRSLVEANRALALRALASAQGVSDAVLVEILELSGGWEERRKVFEQIPEQLGDAERALLLIDRLRRRTRDGNDLFFLDLAAGAVAERWEGAARPHARRATHRARLPSGPLRASR